LSAGRTLPDNKGLILADFLSQFVGFSPFLHYEKKQQLECGKLKMNTGEKE
jgi:hypothetical protein